MPRARSTLVCLESTPYYHCVSRCVRRAFLCGDDHLTGQSFEHRRGWIEARLLELSSIFAIDLCAYAVMSNHYHVVLHVDTVRAKDWTDSELIARWQRLFKLPVLIQRYQQNTRLSRSERAVVDILLQTWRSRLVDISWYMRCANEPIAREANKEDQASGRFWEGRFKSQALLDEKALLACMAYVDLNPIRAQMADTPEASDHTSIQRRIAQTSGKTQPNTVSAQPRQLLRFAGYPRKNMPDGLPFRLTDYLDLVDWTGRLIREDKKGHIPHTLPPILQRLDMDAENWCYLSRHFESPFKHLVGALHNVKAACDTLGKQWVHGMKHCERLFSSG